MPGDRVSHDWLAVKPWSVAWGPFGWVVRDVNGCAYHGRMDARGGGKFFWHGTFERALVLAERLNHKRSPVCSSQSRRAVKGLEVRDGRLVIA